MKIFKLLVVFVFFLSISAGSSLARASNSSVRTLVINLRKIPPYSASYSEIRRILPVLIREDPNKTILYYSLANTRLRPSVTTTERNLILRRVGLVLKKSAGAITTVQRLKRIEKFLTNLQKEINS